MKSALKSQYYASLTMLDSAIRQCNDELWVSEKYQHQFWWLAYHALYYADFYLASSEHDYVPWEKHQPALEGVGEPMDPRSIKAENLPADCRVYTQSELSDYANRIMGGVGAAINLVDLEGPSGFHWLPFRKLELQLYNIRHIQHHAGQLIERIRETQNDGVRWVGMDPRLAR